MNSCKLNSSNVCEKISQNSVQHEPLDCATVAIPLNETLYYNFQWVMHFQRHVIALKYLRENNTCEAGVSLSISNKNKIFVVPEVSHDIVIHFCRLHSDAPCFVKVTLKTSYDHMLRAEQTQCKIEMSFSQVIQLSTELFTRRNHVDHRLAKLGIMQILQHMNRKHYILGSELHKTNYLTTHRICRDALNATAFSYLTYVELKEIGEIVKGNPTLVYTGFRNKPMVNPSLYAL